MKAKIITLLKRHYPEYVSGEHLSLELGVSRTAVWKHIRSLREAGYRIEAQSRIGYRLVQVPERLDKHELKSLLTTKVIGRDVVYLETVDSTNDLAKKMAQQGVGEGAVIISEEQTRGKGRMGREWHSPAGQGLWFSVILRPKISPIEASKLTLVGAVAVAKTIRQYTCLEAGIKWPNDILIDNRKVCGILTEMNAELDKINYLVLGIGINFSLSPETLPAGLADIATSLNTQHGIGSTRTEFLAGLLLNLESFYYKFSEGKFAEILSSWRELSITLNRWVKITSLNEIVEGIAFDIDDEGALLVMKKDGSMKRILTGDVTLRIK